MVAAVAEDLIPADSEALAAEISAAAEPAVHGNYLENIDNAKAVSK